MDVVVWFGGGGSLGGFDAGVWAALAPRLRAHGARVVALGGASIGALNAAFLARHAADDDHGATVLESIWRGELATPSFAFNGALEWAGDRDSRSWNGLLTGLLLGNRRLYRAAPMHWNALHGLERRRHPLMDRDGEWRWLAARLGSIPRRDDSTPLLCAAAVDVLAGEIALFDNASAPLGIEALAASSAIPLLFDPVEIDGRLHWDGEMTRETALPAFLRRARERGAMRDPARTVLVAVDHMSRALPRVPESGAEIADRAIELLLHGKTRIDGAALQGVGHVVRIEREPMPHDGISGQFDYSPERIGELLAQGAEQAARAWSDAGLLLQADARTAEAAAAR
jgi:NTE family protein